MTVKPAIVGGGVGGMMTALLLARRGQSSVIYERAETLGGRLAFARSEDGRFAIDQGPTIVLLPDMLKEHLAAAGIGEEAYELIPCEPMYRIHYADGTVLTKWRDEGRMEEELERLAAGDGKAFRAYMSDMADSYQLGQSAILTKPLLKPGSLLSADSLRLLIRLRAYRSARGLAKAYFKSEKSVDAFSLQTLYIGGLPYATPSLYTFIPYAEHAFGIWYWKGGYASLAQLLTDRLVEAGVELQLGVYGDVSRLVYDESGMAGLIVQNGAFKAHSNIVFNGDFPALHPLLSCEGGMPVEERRRFTPSSGALLIYCGCDRRWDTEAEANAAAHQFVIPSSLSNSLKRMSAGRLAADQGKELPAYYVFNPALLDHEAYTQGTSALYFLVPVPFASEETLAMTMAEMRQWYAELAEHILADAEKRLFPGLRGSIRWKKIRTPEDGKQEGWHEGGAFGIAPSLLQSGPFRPQLKPYPIDGLYAAGASIHPGGGIPIVMEGARQLADYLMKERFS